MNLNLKKQETQFFAALCIVPGMWSSLSVVNYFKVVNLPFYGVLHAGKGNYFAYTGIYHARNGSYVKTQGK